MKFGYSVAIAASLALAGCGGDGSVSPVPTPSPSPTPTPSPTPLPSPTPTPTSSYAKFADIVEDTALATACWGYERLDDGSTLVYDSPAFGDGLDMAFDAAEAGYVIAGAEFSYTFPLSSREIHSGSEVYRTALGRGEIVELIFPATEAEYSRTFTLHRSNGTSASTLIDCIAGVETAAEEMPTTPVDYKALTVEGSVMLDPDTYGVSSSTGTVTFLPITQAADLFLDLAGKNLTATPSTEDIYRLLSVVAREPLAVVGARFEGELAVERIDDAIGSVGGAFFGPEAAEVAIRLAFEGNYDGSRAASAQAWYLGTRAR